MDSGQWTVAPNRERRKTKVEGIKRERVGGGKEVLSPTLPYPAPSPFFVAHFSLRFPNYLKACYRLTTCIHHFQLLMVYIQLERRALLALCYWSAGTDLVVLTFQLLLDCEFFFLSSLTHLPPSLPRRAPSAPDKRERPLCFAPDHSFDYSTFLAYAKSTRCFVVWKTLHWLTF